MFNIDDPDQWYINQPGKGADDHTGAFMAGYDQGFASCNAQEPQPVDQAQSQAQSNDNNNENNNDNSLSQSQATTIYICKEGACTPQ